MVQSRRFPATPLAISALPPVSAPVPPAHLATPPARRSRAFACGVGVYMLLLFAAFATGSMVLDEFAVFALVSVLLLRGLRRGSGVAWSLWLGVAILLTWLARRGLGQLALDSLPIMINAALCVVFARTLGASHEPLIAHIISVLEGPQRLAMPRVAGYARHLTLAWALLLGLQACVLLVVVACTVPDGMLASFGIVPPFPVSHVWRWYLHLGSYALVLGFLMLEYAFRRWHLRHLPHAPLPIFIARLARRWPALVASFAAGTARSTR